jgi:hypothetical protein
MARTSNPHFFALNRAIRKLLKSQIISELSQTARSGQNGPTVILSDGPKTTLLDLRGGVNGPSKMVEGKRGGP